ncbi:MAG: hypothetical protein F6K17_10910 [Okeania sp. SIO3C4]|nr:hypothetical protein [Okeania sp. SIO3C4]
MKYSFVEWASCPFLKNPGMGARCSHYSGNKNHQNSPPPKNYPYSLSVLSLTIQQIPSI